MHLETWWGRDLLLSSLKLTDKFSVYSCRTGVPVLLLVVSQGPLLAPRDHPQGIVVRYPPHAVHIMDTCFFKARWKKKSFFKSLPSGRAESFLSIYLIRIGLPSIIVLFEQCKDNGFGILITFAKPFAFVIKHKLLTGVNYVIFTVSPIFKGTCKPDGGDLEAILKLCLPLSPKQKVTSLWV